MKVRLSANTREILAGAVILFAIVTLAFAPFAYGDRTLMSSAAETQAVYPTGGSPDPPARGIIFKGLDPGAAAWQTEPEFLLEHDLVRREHVFPLWNPYVAYGQPLAANMLSQPFYPLTWIMVADRSARAYNWFIILRFFAAAFFAFLFLRFFVRFIAALAGGIGFAFTGYLLLYYNIAHLSVECLIPALMWAMESMARRRDPISVARLAVIICIVMFGGMPESAFLAFLFSYLYFVTRIVFDANQRPAWRDAGVKLGIATVLGLGMSACLLLPFAEFTQLSANRHEERLIGRVMGVINDGFSFGYLAPYLTPLIYGPPWSSIFGGFSGWTTIRGFFGVAQVELALIVIGATVSEFRTRRSRPWSPELYLMLAAIFILLKRFGSPVVNWTGALPGLSLITIPKYEEALLGFCVACLAAFGIERIAAGRIRAVEVWLATLIPLGVLTGTAAVEKVPFQALTLHRSYYVEALLFGLLVLGTIAALAWAATRSAWSDLRPRFAIAVSAVVLAEALGSYFIPIWYVYNAEAPLSRAPVNGAPFVDFLRKETAGNYLRVYGEDGTLFPEWSAPFEISDVRDLNAMYDFRYPTFLQAFLPPGADSELIDRFTGLRQVDFRSPSELRFLQLSSVGLIASTHRLDGDPSLLSQAVDSRPADINPALRHGTFTIGDSRRDAVFMHAPRIQYPVTVSFPADAKMLRYSIGMDAEVWTNPAEMCGDGVTFALDVRTVDGRVVRLAQEYIDPKHNVGDRKWFDRSVPIQRWAGQRADLLFSTLPGPSGSNCSDWALWSDVLVDGSQKHVVASPFTVAYTSPSLSIYRYRDPLPRLSVYTNVVLAADDQEALSMLGASAFDPFRTAIVTSRGTDRPQNPLGVPHPPFARVQAGRILEYSSQYVSASVDTPVPALAVLNDTDYPGWVALVDGRETEILTTNYMFRGVRIPPGHHSLEFQYRPRSFELGFALSIVSAIVTIGYVVLSFRKAAGNTMSRQRER